MATLESFKTYVWKCTTYNSNAFYLSSIAENEENARQNIIIMIECIEKKQNEINDIEENIKTYKRSSKSPEYSLEHL
jgi:hypothetical protein